MEKNRYIVLAKINNIVLRAKQISKGYSLYLDIHTDGKRYREFLKLYLSTINKKKYTVQDKKILQLANNILAEKSLIISKGNYQPEIIKDISILSYLNDIVQKKILNNDKSKWKWISTLKYFKMYFDDNIKFTQINRKHLEGFKNYLLGNIQQNTAATYFSILSSVFELAIKDNIINNNPMRLTKKIKIVESKRTFLTQEELQILINTHFEPAIVKKAFLFACYTGLRWADIHNLKYNDIIFEHGNYYLYITVRKNQKQERIKIHKNAIQYIGKINKSNNPVFQLINNNKQINKYLHRWEKLAGINKHITFHVARHTFATILLNNDVDIYTVSKLLGHADIKTTEIYAKLLDKKKEDAIDKLPDF